MTSHRAALLPLAAAAALALPAAAPADPRAPDSTLTGTSESARYGRVTVTFDLSPGMVRLLLSRELQRTAAKKELAIECRARGAYTRVASFRLLGATGRGLGAPAVAPKGTQRCRVLRRAWTDADAGVVPTVANSTVVAQMRMRRQG